MLVGDKKHETCQKHKHLKHDGEELPSPSPT